MQDTGAKPQLYNFRSTSILKGGAIVASQGQHSRGNSNESIHTLRNRNQRRHAGRNTGRFIDVLAAVVMFNTCDDIIDRLRDEAGHLLVRRACDRDDWIGSAVLDVAAGDKREWTPSEWSAMLADLHRTPGNLADWLDLNT